MNILILQGPNLNLLGLKSAPTGDRLTLDKLNKALRKHVHRQETTLKFLQTHKARPSSFPPHGPDTTGP